jgi:DNA-binding transcriptional ArsR family regulator
MQTLDFAALETQAHQASALLKQIGNEHRLLLLCQLAAAGEMTVTQLAEAVGLSQSALSQHLARLRAKGIVGFRREAQTLHYRLIDQRVVRILKALKQVFCP